MLRAADELFATTACPWDVGRAGGTFDTRQLLDVMITVGGYRWNSMLINSAGVQLDANMADFRFPLPLR